MNAVVGRSPARHARALQVLTLMVGMTCSAVAAQSDPLPADDSLPAPSKPAEQPKAAPSEAAASSVSSDVAQTKAAPEAKSAPTASPAEQAKAAMSAQAAEPAAKSGPRASPAEQANPAPAAMTAEAATPAAKPAPAAMSAELAKPAPAAMSAELAKPLAKSEQLAVVDAQAPASSQAVEVPVQQQQGFYQQPGPRVIRNLVVPHFIAPEKSRARAAVLGTLADHAEVEVVSIDDVTFASRRLQADPTTPAGREKLSRELGIDAWLDGEVTETTAHLTLTAGDGTVLHEVDVETENERHLDALTGERMWAVLGPSLSPQEAYRRALLTEYDRARRKFEARMAAEQRQVQLAHEARAHRAFILRAQFSLAQRKRAALSSELTRQTELGRAELAREAEVARQAELARQAEIARKAELARQAEQARKAEIARKAAEAKAAEQARKAEIARKAQEAKAAAAARKAEAARKVEAAKVAKADAARNRRQAAAEAAAEKKAKADRALAKKRAKRGMGNSGLTNTGAQRVQQAKALAKKKKKARAKQATSNREQSPRPAKARSSAAVGGKAESQLLSRQ